MEPTTVSKAFGHALSIIRNLPLWLLTAIALSLFVFIIYPVFHESVVPATMIWIKFALIVSVILVACRLVSVVVDYLYKHRMRERDRDVPRFENVYTQLYILFITRHVTEVISQGVTFRQRVRNAHTIIKKIKDHPRPVRNILAAARALFDRQIERSAEIEYGPGFPLDQIKVIICQNAKICDQKLLNLVARADRARYEVGGSDMTSEELALYEYISERHTRLSKHYG